MYSYSDAKVLTDGSTCRHTVAIGTVERPSSEDRSPESQPRIAAENRCQESPSRIVPTDPNKDHASKKAIRQAPYQVLSTSIITYC